MEHAVLIPQSVANDGQSQVCTAIQKTGGQPTETAVPQARVQLKFGRFFHRDAIFLEGRSDVIFKVEVQDCIGKGTADEKLKRQIVDAASSTGPYPILSRFPAGG